MSKMKKKELGKGIRALLSNVEETSKADQKEIVKELSSTTAMIPVEQIEINPFQPRKQFDETALDELKQSIQTHGVIQPITLRRLGPSSYQVISGERRLRASKKAGLAEIPAYVRLANDQEMLEMALVENIQRQDLNAVEVAITYQRLMDECDLTHEMLSDRVGKNRSTVTNYIRLLKLPPEIQQSIKDRKLSMGHARSLAGMTDISAQLHVFHKVINEGLSVRATERLVKSLETSKSGSVKKTSASGRTPEVIKIEDRLTDRFETRVKIERNAKGKGKIVIPFSDNDTFNELLDLLERD